MNLSHYFDIRKRREGGEIEELVSYPNVSLLLLLEISAKAIYWRSHMPQIYSKIFWFPFFSPWADCVSATIWFDHFSANALKNLLTVML